MYVPSLPSLGEYFQTSQSRVQLTVSLNMLAFGLAQLIHGPLSDRFGRRPVLIGSLLLVIVFSLCCALATTIEQLIAARIALGSVAAAEAVVGLAIIKDLYSERQQVKAFALLGMVIAIAPGIAPIIGGYLHVLFGWQSNFVFIAVLALIALLVVRGFLPESTSPDKLALAPMRLLRNYRTLLGNREFVIHSMILGVGLGLIFVFVTAAPYVLIDLLDVPTQRFGYYQAMIVVAFFTGSLLASRASEIVDSDRLLKLGLGTIVLGAVLLSTLILFDQHTPVTFTAAYTIMTFGMGPMFAVAPSLAMRSIQGGSGAASAMLSGIEQTTAAMAAVAVTLLADQTARPIALVSMALTIVLLCLIRARNSIKQSAD
jgi:DHA1 family bicyclomycin/chloramphenicol resistance-like MFS transporter